MTVGELYKRLVLFSDDELPPESYHIYYQKVKDTIKEAKEELPPYKIDEYGVNVNLPNWSLDVIDWFERWFGND